MCLIIAGPSANIRSTLLNTTGMIADIFQSNSDGLGVMYKNKRGLRVVKILANTVTDITRFIDQLPQDDRDLTMHWRMRTHGKIDLENCHPYDVVPGKVALVHNGILDNGNAADPTKSDTWHFIRKFLMEPIEKHPDLIHSEGFIKLLGEYIGSNRFVFMDDRGRMSIINKDQGVEHGSLWFSNTYAWSPEMLIPGYKPSYSGYSVYDEDGDDDSWASYYRKRGQYKGFSGSYNGRSYSYSGSGSGYKGNIAPIGGTQVLGLPPGRKFSDDERRDFFESVNYGLSNDVRKVLRSWPHTATEELLRCYRPSVTNLVASSGVNGQGITAMERTILDALLGHNLTNIGTLATQHPNTVADVICYYLNWELLVPDRAPLTGDDKTADTDPDADAEVPDHVTPDLAADLAEPGVEDKWFTYRNCRIHVFFDEDVKAWGYATQDDDGMGVDHGIGYDDRAQALSWATGELDRMLEQAAAHLARDAELQNGDRHVSIDKAIQTYQQAVH